MLRTNSNITNVAFNYLQILNVPFTQTSLRDNLQTNPFYPSLYSLSCVFQRFNINNDAFEIEKDKLEELQPPFIAYLKNQRTGKDFVLVTAIQKNEIKYIADRKKIRTTTKNDFLKDWLNIIFIAEPNSKSGEADFSFNHKKEVAQKNKTRALIGGAIFIFVAIISFLLNSVFLSQFTALSEILITKILGVAITVLLLVYEIDKSNSFVKNICTAGRQTNCHAVLQSKGSRIFGMSWSEAGFFYFAATFLFLLFPGISFTTKIFLLSIASCLAAPYILFSIYYQWKIVKQWCPLCLIAQAILATELAWSIINFWSHPYLPSSLLFTILPVIISVLSPIILWNSLKPVIIGAKDEPDYKAAYKRLLYNPETFNSILQQQPVAPMGYQQMGITTGNPDAPITILKVCNPYCGPCAKAHKVLDNLVHNNKNVKVKLIFTASNDPKDRVGIVAKHLLAIDAKKDRNLTELSLDDWYLAEKKDYDVFAAKYPMNGELKQQEAQIEMMREWCEEAEIRGTPTLFINGYKLPEKYKIDELKYIL